MSATRRIDALDGVRALAVAGVVAFHAGATWVPGGSLGVDVFFVLSGFLITGLLVGRWEATGRVGLLRFYGRRVRRLLPALLLVVAALLIWSAVGMDGPGRSGVYRGVGGTLLYVANWQSAYATLPPLALTDHAWSLSIEEQFYLLWPLLLLGLLTLVRRGRLPRAAVLALTLAGAAASGLARAALWHGPGSIDRVYYGTDTRAEALLVGCALALTVAWYGPALARRLPRAWRWAWPYAATVLGLGWLLWQATASSWRQSWTYHGGLTCAALAAAALIAGIVAAPDRGLGRLLAARPLVAVGRISYGLYLWHWPVFIVLNGARVHLAWTPLLLLRLAVTLALATASYLLVERRVLAPSTGRARTGPPHTPPLAAAPTPRGPSRQEPVPVPVQPPGPARPPGQQEEEAAHAARADYRDHRAGRVVPRGVADREGV